MYINYCVELGVVVVVVAVAGIFIRFHLLSHTQLHNIKLLITRREKGKTDEKESTNQRTNEEQTE